MMCKSLNMLQTQCLRYSLDPETRLIDRHLISRYCTRVSTMILGLHCNLKSQKDTFALTKSCFLVYLFYILTQPYSVNMWLSEAGSDKEQPGHQTFDLTAFCVFDYFCVEVKVSVCIFVLWLFYIKETHLRGKGTGRSWPFDPNLGWREKESMCQCIYSTVRRHNQSLKSF